MTAIDRLSPLAPAAALDPARGTTAVDAASRAIGDIGQRVLAWVGAVGGAAPGAAAWAARAGSGDPGFVPDAGVLARRGDIYGLNAIAGDLSARFGGTPTQEGDLLRALEGVARGAMVQAAGLSGASGERQIAGLSAALDAAQAAPAGEGMDGVIARIDAAAATLGRQNGF
ncbi:MULTISPECIES: hypothetical protein [Sphingomonas]|uniref:Uncharacterized protein n=1 Tax=Sphingomonas adhaesiva TaxID=28212 RepID=A0A2A4I6C7_9SPHN|nr:MULTISPECIES: hypothetical protein [Sphingomonas]PCG14039.1 hypothetical protein COA07_12100 [Sphingomonas adhaesiva]PZU82070.1 MAG: hypothetical protein DI530_00310 [Sphingomonas sp.]